MERIVQGTYCPRDASSKGPHRLTTYVRGHIGRGRIEMRCLANIRNVHKGKTVSVHMHMHLYFTENYDKLNFAYYFIRKKMHLYNKASVKSHFFIVCCIMYK
jgi:hypothetical protein